jgi:nitrate/TMAO reductase-like tetraheme cytochrome c subunit
VKRPSIGVIVMIVLGVLVVGGGITGAGLWHATASPQFCGSCHIMRPYVAAWKASRHRDVVCVQCHYPPQVGDMLWVKFQAMTQVAKWMTQTYSSKPFADVRDASCLRSGCHARDALGRGTTTTFKRTVRFDHARHLDPAKTGVPLRCTSCHAQTVVDKHFEVGERVCFACHFKGAKTDRTLTPLGGCTACHQAPSGVITSARFDHAEMVRRAVPCQQCHVNVVVGAGSAPRDRCIGCHNEREKLDRFADVTRVHEAHVHTRSIECTRCHDEITHRLPPRMAGAFTAPSDGPRVER